MSQRSSRCPIHVTISIRNALPAGIITSLASSIKTCRSCCETDTSPSAPVTVTDLAVLPLRHLQRQAADGQAGPT